MQELIVTCYGHLDMVEYLLDRCGVSLEVGSSVHFHGETIESTQWLWATSAAGHLDVVWCLLLHGALVNCTVCTNSVPPA